MFIDITHGKVHDVNLLDILIPEPGSFLVMDRAYLDFARLYALHQALAFFVTRAKANLQFRRRYFSTRGPLQRSEKRPDHFTDWTAQSQALSRPTASSHLLLGRNRPSLGLSDQQLFSRSSDRRSSLPCRWQIELFFKWIKQHLRIKRFFGTSANSVKTQIWIAVSVYVLIAIIKKQLGLKAQSLHNSTDSQSDSIRKKAHSKPV